MTAPAGPIVAIAAIAAVEGVGLIGYAGYDLVETVRLGVGGPTDVSNVPAVTLLIVIQVLFGAGLLWVARGWWLGRRWARSPFLVAQILAVLVGYELAQSDGAAEKSVGIAAAVLAAAGIALAFTPAASRALDA